MAYFEICLKLQASSRLEVFAQALDCIIIILRLDACKRASLQKNLGIITNITVKFVPVSYAQSAVDLLNLDQLNV